MDYLLTNQTYAGTNPYCHFLFLFYKWSWSGTQQQHHSIPLKPEGLADSDSSDADHTGQKIPKLI